MKASILEGPASLYIIDDDLQAHKNNAFSKEYDWPLRLIGGRKGSRKNIFRVYQGKFQGETTRILNPSFYKVLSKHGSWNSSDAPDLAAELT